MKKMLLQRNLVFIPVLAMLFFCLMAVPSFAAKKPSKSAPQKVKSESVSYATTPFDDTWKILPKNYHGHDIRAVYKALSKNLNLQKDQFETEAQFEQRKKQAWKKTILGNMTADDHFAFIEEAQEKEYDAEKAKFIFKIFSNIGVVIQSKRTGENRLGQDLAKRTTQNEKRKRRMRGQDTTGTDLAGALLEGAVRAGGVWEVFTVNFGHEDRAILQDITLDMQPEEARKNKDNIRVLIVGNISDFSPPKTEMKFFSLCTSHSLDLELKNVIIYNRQTGEIYRTFDFGEERRLKEEQEKEERRIWESRFTRHESGMVLDNQTGLMWAPQDNGSNVDWQEVKSYCENYRGGGFSDWRMPTQDELASLYDKKWQNKDGYHLTDSISITHRCFWASKTRGSASGGFDFGYGGRSFSPQCYGSGGRALPVRSGIDGQSIRQNTNAAYLGIAYDMLTHEVAARENMTGTTGALIIGVAADSPAVKGGLKAGDVISAIDGKTIDELKDCQEIVKNHKPGDVITLTIVRGSAKGPADKQDVKITLGKGPVKQRFEPKQAAPAPAPAKPAAAK